MTRGDYRRFGGYINNGHYYPYYYSSFYGSDSHSGGCHDGSGFGGGGYSGSSSRYNHHHHHHHSGGGATGGTTSGGHLGGGGGHSAMDATFIWKLSKLGRIGSSRLRFDDDFADRLNYQFSGVLMFLFIGVIGIRQYVGMFPLSLFQLYSLSFKIFKPIF
ncbi:unnamed protein product [Rodentolepis nana]|uniref:Innexin n=1 Tax=Rodentolepis nana TaxID=102285 RepID=A0A0R3TJP0_RODNA|nr:unnamed protein product [Rodentolepis nana]